MTIEETPQHGDRKALAAIGDQPLLDLEQRRPGMNCLWCNQLINPGKLADEAKLNRERKAQRYVDDDDVIAPSVITLNAVGAAHACDDFLYFMTGLTAPTTKLDFARYDGRSRSMSLSSPRTDPACTECSSGVDCRLGHGSTCPALPTFAG